MLTPCRPPVTTGAHRPGDSRPRPQHLAIRPASWSGHCRGVRPVSRFLSRRTGLFHYGIAEPSRAIASDLHDDATKISLDGRVLAYGITTACFTRPNGARFRRARAVLVGLQPQRIGKTRVSLSSAKLASTEPGVESNRVRSDDEIASANHRAEPASGFGAQPDVAG